MVSKKIRHDPFAEDRATLLARLNTGREELANLARSLGPMEGHRLIHATRKLVDEIVLGLAALRQPEPQGGEGLDPADRDGKIQQERSVDDVVAIVALGGYGRGELSPRSDVDLLFLTRERGMTENAAVVSYVNKILYGLWDFGFEVGQAVRCIDEAIEVAGDDQGALTALLDGRLLTLDANAGGPRSKMFAELMKRVDAELLAGPRAPKYIEQKLEEAKRRRERFGGSVFLLEPNVKESEGGLRELHSALWIARARWRARGVRDLLHLGVLSPREGRTLRRAHGFLLRVRAQLHLEARRRQDILGYEYQEPVARSLGYIGADTTDIDRRIHGVERFMHAYYYHAHEMRVHSQRIIERACAQSRRRPPYLQTLRGGFKVWEDNVTVADRTQFVKDPTSLIRIFRIAQEEALEIYSYTKDLITEARHSIDYQVRRDPAAVEDFLAMLEDPEADGSIFDLMHDLGVLRKFIPEVRRITGRWQHSLYHLYTVDVHSLMVLKTLKRLRMGAFANEQPELTRLIAGLPRPNVLYLAGFFHDIGKGWPKDDHSARGAKVARTVGERFEAANLASWTREETDDLVWLVQAHLAMSDISQRRDASDLELLDAFVRDVGSIERLTMLYVLTVADMKGTSPKVWTDWKGALLHELFTNASNLIAENERGHTLDIQAHIEARRERGQTELLHEAATSGLAISDAALREFAERMSSRYVLTFPPRRMLRHVAMWRSVADRGGVELHVRQLRREDTTEVTIACPDRPGLLAILAGTLAANHLQILSAQIFSVASPSPSAKNVALDVLFVKDETGKICDDPARWERVHQDLREYVLIDEDVRVRLAARVRGTRRLFRPKPVVKTEIDISNSVSTTETVFDVFCQDHLGVLHTIAQALTDQQLSISLAKISTQGDRVADGFYVTDAVSGGKIEDPGRLAAIKRALVQAIEEGARPPAGPAGPASA